MMNALTKREREIALAVAMGLSNKAICRRLSIAEGTVKIHLHNIYEKLGIANRTMLAVAMAMRAQTMDAQHQLEGSMSDEKI